MEALVAVAILAASLLHASWHAMVKSSGDRVVALGGMNVVSGTAALACIPFVKVPSPDVMAVIGFSVLLHCGYKVALARLYARADLGQAYTLARGCTPLIATVLGALFLMQRPSAASLSGVVLISCGLLLLVAERGAARISLGTVGVAGLAGTAVASYSVVDAYGIRLGGDWSGFTVWLIVMDALVFVTYVLLTRGRSAVRAWRADPWITLVTGLLGLTSFGVFMWALGRAHVGAVTALRETSILFAALIGAIFLGERATVLRYASAVVVMTGVAVVSFAR